MITKVLTGCVTAGVVGLYGAAAAHADPDPIDWNDGNTVPTYNIGDSLMQGANGSYYDGASFTNGDTTLEGNQILLQNFSGGYNNVFAVYDSANLPTDPTSPYPPLDPFAAYDIYNVNQWGGGFTNVYSDVAGNVTDILKTPIGNVDISWLGWMFAPSLYLLTAAGMPSTPVTDPTEFFNEASDAGLYSAFNAADGTLDPTDFFSAFGF